MKKKRIKKKKIFIALFSFLIILTLLFFLSFLFISSPLENINKLSISPTLRDKNGELFYARLSAESDWLIPVPIEKMGAWLPFVAINIEDKRFYQHQGISFLSLARAITQNIKHKKIISGASTITVQVVKLSSNRKRTFFNKYVEFIQAYKLEKELSKNEILELYLNQVSFGGNIRGVEAASRIYFAKSAQDLSLSESALLIAILRGPSIYRPDRYPQLALKRRDLILDSLLKRKVISFKQYKLAKDEQIQGRRTDIPKKAWHFSNLLLKDDKPWFWMDKENRYGLKTSLDLELQTALELRLKQALDIFPNRISGAGAILDNNKHTILAYVGQIKKDNDLNLTWLDCVQAPRSPGSVLKPFIYLQAFEDRKLNFDSLLADTPLKLAGRAPRNFDGYYRGPVSTQMALAQSLNVPAVRVLNLSGGAKSLNLLRKLGFSYLTKDSNHYGDSLVLGGVEVNLWQVLNAYGILANLGVGYESELLLLNQSKNKPKVFFSKESTWMISEILKNTDRFDLTAQMNIRSLKINDFAFKTGTSHGLRDVWLAGYDPEHTFVFWLGDPSGQSHPDLIAFSALSETSINLASDLKNKKTNSKWFQKPDNVFEFKACIVSGEPAGPFCPSIRPSYRLTKTTHPCQLHVKSLEGNKVLWPEELAAFMSKEQKLKPGSKIMIVSPLNKSKIVLESLKEEMKIPLVAEGTKGNVYWFLNGDYLTTNNKETPLLEVKPGKHILALVDDSGRITKSNYEVIIYSPEIELVKEIPVLNFE